MYLKACTFALSLLPLAATAETALSELAERSRVSEAELALILADCDATQRNMNLCSFHDMILAERQLDQLVIANGIGTAQEHAAFKQETYADCTHKAETDAGGGSMMPLLITSCVAEIYVNLHDVILTLAGEMPPQPPGKWE